MSETDYILLQVTRGNKHVITRQLGTAYSARENAKRAAHRWIGGNSENYIVEPLTHKGDQVHLDITLQV